MTMIHFVGAGPGDPDLLTVRARNLLESADSVLYAGSLVPEGILVHAKNARDCINTAPLSLDEIMDHMVRFYRDNRTVVRLHSGDLSLYSAVGEQARRLDELDIPYDMTPGVPAYAAAAAALKCELTLPGVTQSLILTRTATRSSAMPDGETLSELASGNATIAIHLSLANLAKVVSVLTPHYGADCPACVAYRIGWPDALIIRAPLSRLRQDVKAAGITRTGLIFVGPVLEAENFTPSRLYDATHSHVFRPRQPAKTG